MQWYCETVCLVCVDAVPAGPHSCCTEVEMSECLQNLGQQVLHCKHMHDAISMWSTVHTMDSCSNWYRYNPSLYSHHVEHWIAVRQVICTDAGVCLFTSVSWWHCLLVCLQDFRHDGTLKQKLSTYLSEALQDPSTFEGEKEQMKRIIEWGSHHQLQQLSYEH